MARPLADISAADVIDLASRGAKIVEIAEHFNVDPTTIAARFPLELVKGKAILKDSLRHAQIEMVKAGNATMGIWLGKQYLGQSDKSLDEYILEALEVSGLSKEDLLELIRHKDTIAKARPRKSFEEFVQKAGYPPPFAKQVEMMRFIMETAGPHLLLGSRGYGKTDYTTILGTAYDIYLDPLNASNLIVTKSKDRNTAILGEIEMALLKNGVVLDRANSTFINARGQHGKDPSVAAVTIKTKSLRGRHPKRVLMDDPITEDDISEATRTHAQRVYNEVSKLTSNIGIIGQPAHKDDLYGLLRGSEGVAKMEVPWGTIPELDADLEAQKLAGVDQDSIDKSYHLIARSSGTAPFESVKYLDRFPIGESSVAFIDPSDGGDYTALTIMRAYFEGIAVEGFVWKKSWNHALDDMAAHFVRLNVKKVAFETNTTGTQPLDMLRQVFPGVGVVGRRTNSNKHSRIMQAGAFAHQIHLSKKSDKIYIDQVVKYDETSKFDDAPDSLASLLDWLGLIKGKR